ncbi:putative invertase inhibitor [Humulus lupulus]|uniref:putative invertase inhibitor n=1 Tax=Humulus lupulus TaxID=3486 RepID=UPI002B40C216|nr:putative invertase inhibitor [Humulus lupulus]
MGSFPFFSFFLFTICIIFSSLQSCTLGCSDLIKQSCKKATNDDPNLSYNICIKIVGVNSKANKAKTIEELALASIDLAICNATKVASTISNVLRSKVKVMKNNYTEGCLKDCLKIYSDAISSLREAKHAIRVKDFKTANVEISSAMDAPSTCEDGFIERQGEVSPITKENQVFFQHTVVSLAFNNMDGHLGL